VASNQKQKTKRKLTHFDDHGAAWMVNVSGKEKTSREAVAEGVVYMLPETLSLILNRSVSKGDVFGVARVAGIMAAKKTSEIIPLCHPLNLTSVEISFEPDKKRSSVRIQATVKTLGQTGVEMEALTAVTAACLTVYDMCKAVDRAMVISDVRLMKKTGGKSGTFIRARAR
jgi:cyclic pyranopterin phosphate synthase